MSNNKQSSVEHFWQQLEEKGNAHIKTEGVIKVKITIDVNEYRLLQKQAKEMEKQRMFDFAKSFVYTWNYITKGNFESTKDMNKELENLFEETYGGVNK
jgi:hypothetical protein